MVDVVVCEMVNVVVCEMVGVMVVKYRTTRF